MSVNKTILLGRLGSDPELKHTASGAAVCNFSLATSESWNDKATGGKQERTEWHRIVVWGKLAELCNQYLAKGRQAFVEGKLTTRSWETDSGEKRYTTEINATTVQFIGGQASEGQGQKESTPKQDYDPSYNASFAADSIPF